MAKKFVKFNKVVPEGKVVIDAYAPIFAEKDLEEILPSYLPYTHLYKEIVIKNFNSLQTPLLQRLTMQYLHGAEITVEVAKAGFAKTYHCIHSKDCMFTYSFETLDWVKLPKSIAEYKIHGVKIIDILAKSKPYYIPNTVWTAIDKISNERIAACQEFNKGNYAFAELWYKELFFDYHSIGRKVYSPNEKTFYECMAEIDFAKQVKACYSDEVFTEAELDKLRKYATAYGVDIPKFSYRINSRKTNHGYTSEIERVCTPMTDSEIAVAVYDFRNDNLPAHVRKGLWHKSIDCPKYIREAIQRLEFLMSYGDEFLMPGWKRCPQCGDVYHETRGCENCGGVEPLEFLSAENLFYSNASAFEDMDATTEAYKEMMTLLESEEHDLV